MAEFNPADTLEEIAKPVEGLVKGDFNIAGKKIPKIALVGIGGIVLLVLFLKSRSKGGFSLPSLGGSADGSSGSSGSAYDQLQQNTANDIGGLFDQFRSDQSKLVDSSVKSNATPADTGYNLPPIPTLDLPIYTPVNGAFNDGSFNGYIADQNQGLTVAPASLGTDTSHLLKLPSVQKAITDNDKLYAANQKKNLTPVQSGIIAGVNNPKPYITPKKPTASGNAIVGGTPFITPAKPATIQNSVLAGLSQASKPVSVFSQPSVYASPKPLPLPQPAKATGNALTANFLNKPVISSGKATTQTPSKKPLSLW